MDFHNEYKLNHTLISGSSASNSLTPEHSTNSWSCGLQLQKIKQRSVMCIELWRLLNRSVLWMTPLTALVLDSRYCHWVCRHVTGDLVFIKDERNKKKARKRYIIVKTKGKYATLKNLTTKFNSRQYQVPLVNLYLACGPSYNFTDLQFRKQTDSSDSDFVEEPADDLIDREEIPPLPPQENTHQRPLRQRNQPQWMRSGDDDLETDWELSVIGLMRY